jgi:hypothetical protein
MEVFRCGNGLHHHCDKRRQRGNLAPAPRLTSCPATTVAGPVKMRPCIETGRV